jgi:hypothetical protein
MIVKIVVPDSIYANVYFARGEQGPQGVTGNTGPQGPSGIVNVDSPITNSGTTTAANIGLNQALIQIAPAQVTGTAVVTADSRLSDQRVPTDGSVTDTKIVAGGLSPNRVTGTAVITTDARLSDSRTPTAHAATHASAGSDPVTLAQSQITNLVSDLTAKAPIDSPVFTTKVTLPVTSGTFLGTNSLGEIYKVGGAPGLGYVPYTASVGGGIAWQLLSNLAKTDVGNNFVGAQTISAGVASGIPIQVNAFTGQTADLAQFRDTSLNVVTKINSAGLFSTTRNITIAESNAGEKAFIIRGAVSQSASLQEWQNSAGTVVARVSSAGALVSTQSVVSSGDISSTGGAVNAFNGLVRLGGENSGGFTHMTRQTAAAANPGANIGKLYFRDGTNAGTLKLVVRAGAAGAETTILDNIPQ